MAGSKGRFLAAIAVIGLLTGAVPGAGAQGDPDAARRAARERRAAVTAEIDTLTASDAELAAAIEKLEADLVTQQSELEKARREVEAAEQALAAAREQVAITQRAIRELKELIVDRAVTEYVDPPAFDLAAFVKANDLGQATRLHSLLRAVADRDEDVVDLLEAAEKQLKKQEAAAEDAAEAATARREETDRKLKELEASKASLHAMKQALEVRIAEFRAEADALAAEEAELTRIIEERAEEQRRIAAAQAAAAAQAGRAAPAPMSSGNGQLGWPTSGRVTSGFGPRWGRLHAGIDMGAPVGTEIRAAGAGTVFFAGWRGGYGNTVLIDHGGGLTTLYGHQSRIAVGNGARVERGTVIGYVGNTGNSTGPHLHFETRVNGAPRDPRSYL